MVAVTRLSLQGTNSDWSIFAIPSSVESVEDETRLDCFYKKLRWRKELLWYLFVLHRYNIKSSYMQTKWNQTQNLMHVFGYIFTFWHQLTKCQALWSENCKKAQSQIFIFKLINKLQKKTFNNFLTGREAFNLYNN